MDYKGIVAVMAPCGLDCSRCAEYKDGEIRQTSAKLVELLGSYQRVASLKETVYPVYHAYPQFMELLHIFAKGHCGGCRSDENYCPVDCPAKTCHRKKGVDFCFQCQEFPCDQTMPTGERWLSFNHRMKEIGVEAFFVERNKLPRY